MLFEDFDLSDDLLDALYAMHFEECTPIQEQAIPVVLDRRDLIAIAQTGTGKTAAYLLPVIDLLAELPEADGFVNCIVMAPTRELAQQIERQMDGFSYYLPLSSIAVYGGTDGAGFARQQKGMKAGADVVIATPGRLQALLQMGGIDLSKVRYFVLDEADRMLDMGFYDDIMAISPAFLENVGQCALLVILVAEYGRLLDFLDRARGGNFHLHGVVEQRLGELADFGGHSGREQQGLAFLGEEFGYGHDVVVEAHIEHAVGFVKHEIPDF